MSAHSKETFDQIIDVLDREDYMTIATLRPDGFTQANIVSYVNDGMSVYFGTSDTSQKVKNIAFSDRISASINITNRGWQNICGVSFGGVARLITEPAEYLEIQGMIFKKFPEVAGYAPATDEEAILYRIDPVVATLLDYRRGFGYSRTIKIE